ncbi:MAG: hypothetical protein K1X38_02390 [Microthrixaceae bacterium]|nr:hypothetical protein [Microthrixaceae bacterium]
MFRCRSLAVAVLALWTLLVWGNRIVNITTRDGGDGVDLARAIAFVLVGLAVAVVAVRPMPAPSAQRVVTVAAWASIALWATRIVTIPLGDHEVGFIVVHLVLAAISIALAIWAMRSVRAVVPEEDTWNGTRTRPTPLT